MKNPKCCICGKECENEWGNEAWPVVDDGVCCDECNWEKVLPVRILGLKTPRNVKKEESE